MELDNKQIVHGFWHGTMKENHYLSIQSFINTGHIYKLWVYDKPNIELPKGTILCDANEILPRKRLFYYKGTLAMFADYFRFCLLYREGGWWADCDMLCLKQLPTVETQWCAERYFLEGWYVLKRQLGFWVGLFKVEKHNFYLEQMIIYCENNIDKIIEKNNRPVYHLQRKLGELLFKDGVEDFLTHENINTFNPINCWDISKCFINPKKINDTKDIIFKAHHGYGEYSLIDCFNKATTIHAHNHISTNVLKTGQKINFIYYYYKNFFIKQ